MTRKLITLILGSSLLAATSCGRKSYGPVAPQAMQYLASSPAPQSLQQRYIAERHELDIITPESELERAWQSVADFCGTIQCEVTASSFTARAGDSYPSGSMSLRVAPPDLSKLLTHIQTLGKIAQHTTEREDKTAEVVDSDAKLKNLAAFRDNLRAMLAKPSATVKDLIEIQQQLTDTQSQLDSETGLRKSLANETDKIALALTFRVPPAGATARSFASVFDALRESGSVLAASMAALITVVVAVLPWLIVIVPAFWLLARAWRKRRRNRTVSPAPPQTVA